MTRGTSAETGPPRRPRQRSLDRALAVLALSGLVLAAVLASLLPLGAPGGILLVLFPLVYLVYVGAGLVAWYRRPSNRLGPLIVLAGLSIYLVGLGNSGVPALQLAGDLAGTLPLAAAIHLLHAFPSGRLRGWVSTTTVALGYVAVLVLQTTEVVVRAAGGGPRIEDVLASVQLVLGIVVMAATIGVLVQRLRRAEPLLLRVLIPVYAYVVVAVVLLRSTAALLDLGLIQQEARGLLQLALLAGIPLAFVLGVLAGGFARTGEIEELGGWLGSPDDTRGSLQDALARSLGDPTLELTFWVDDLGLYVDAGGTPVREGASPRGSDRAHVQIERGGERLGRISYDPRAISETWLVESAGNVVALALVGGKLTAELRSSRNELRESRARLVTAAEQERSRIARDLHDGLQMRLVILALDAQRLANSSGLPAESRSAGVALRRSIDDAAAELRQLVTEVDPPGLVEGGLPGGIDDLIDRLPIHVDSDVDPASAQLPGALQRTAYFVVSEALTNVVKHSGATAARVVIAMDERMLRIHVSDEGRGGATDATTRADAAGRGSGLRGLRDRIDVVRGTLRITSSSIDPTGTTITAEIPCES
ncbi:sensor histidine kinase [Herbiconiux sp. P17]|uniref:sensor histidine kinase n=1 Tax=Herbiconiux wuyangfengii TaxID=3342794 RepID=UPI0035B7633E